MKNLRRCPVVNNQIVKQTNIKSSKIGQAAADLHPGYFALVMATGIISIAAFLLGLKADEDQGRVVD